MSQYHYASLSPGSIRLLRLMPLEKERTRIQCDLFEYSLQDAGDKSHLYEALSYVWGGSEKPYSISVNGQNLAITENLYAALSHLQDRSLERVLWVDAICINQGNLGERGQQVQLMAQIYSKANRVLVWLGKTAGDIEGALEHIHLAANEESIEHSGEEMNQRAIKLLQRPWFRRIWVLQEVAAARHIVMMCGSTEIDGYAFCLGLKSLKLSYASPKLQSLPSVTYLIEQAGLRSKYITNSPESFSLKIRSLAELVDMFHDREASNVHDKVYALLGMSSDDPSKAGLRPDYKVSWKELFQQLVKFVLSKDVSVVSSNYGQKAAITSKGCILGQVSSLKSDDRHNVNVTFTSKNTAWCLGDKIEWTLQVLAKSIHERDVVCFLQGASKPTIIRLCEDHFTIVAIAVTPLNRSACLKQLKLSKSIRHFPRDFLLIWDWEHLLERSQDREKSKNLLSLDKATRTWNIALILGDLNEYEQAEKTLREAIEGYKIAFRKDHPYTLKSQYSLTPLSWAAGNGYNAVVNLLLAKDDIDPDLKDSEFGQTPLSWAAERGHEATVKLLLETGKVEVDPKDNNGWTPLFLAACGGYEAVIKLLLETGKVEADLKDNNGWTPLSKAAENGRMAVVKLLLKTGKVEVSSKDNKGQTPFSRAAENGHIAIVRLLLETGKVEANLKDNNGQTPFSRAVGNGHMAMVKLLLETGKVEVDPKDNNGCTPLFSAARGGHEAVIKLLLETGKIEVDPKDNNGCTPLFLAARGGHEAVIKLLLETGKVEVDSKCKSGQTPLSWAACEGHEAVVKLLLETGKVEADLKDNNGRTPLLIATENWREAVAKLLLETGRVDVNWKDNDGRTPLSTAADTGYKPILKLLLDTDKVDVNSKDKHDQTPLLLAVGEGHKAIVKLLLETGKVEVNSKDSSGWTPFSYAADSGNIAMVKLLLETGQVEVNLKDEDGQTPLSLAAYKGHAAVVKLLLETGKVEANLKDNSGRTPLSRAAENGHMRVVKLLELGSK